MHGNRGLNAFVPFLVKRVTSKPNIRELLSIVDVLEMNKQTILTALNSKFNDFEDAMQHYSALDFKQVDIILTRNVKDYKLSEIPVHTPYDYIRSGAFYK